jgi:alpha-beta hydrolase superfamily lysophospholipase
MSILPAHQFEFTSSDGLRIACFRWKNRKPPRGIVQIAHGIGEHMGRYLGLAESLIHAGLVVYGNDHRGHGQSASAPGRLGEFGVGGFGLVVEDVVHLSQIAREENPGQPFILLGHSMGSFAAQKYALDHSAALDGLILSGSGALDGLARRAKTMTNVETFLNAGIIPARTPFDWLSRDPAVASAFVRDPLCFGSLEPASLDSFLSASAELADSRRLRAIRPDLPVYLFSGSEDPIGQRLEGVRILMERYRNAGLFDLAYHFYPGGRHEMLHEINREEVIANILLWISEVLNW